MSYTFTEGKYRAFVRTDFLKAGSSLSTIHKDGRSYEFVCDAPVYEDDWIPQEWKYEDCSLMARAIWTDGNNIYC